MYLTILIMFQNNILRYTGLYRYLRLLIGLTSPLLQPLHVLSPLLFAYLIVLTHLPGGIGHAVCVTCVYICNVTCVDIGSMTYVDI